MFICNRGFQAKLFLRISHSQPIFSAAASRPRFELWAVTTSAIYVLIVVTITALRRLKYIKLQLLKC